MGVRSAAGAAVGCCGGVCAGFRDFVLRGNVVDLAVAIVIGGAFKDLVTAFVAAFLTPLIGMINSQTNSNTGQLYFTVLGSEFPYRLFITALISFIAMCLCIYFLVVLPMNALLARVYPNKVKTRACTECLMDDVPLMATRCKYCCSTLTPPPPPATKSAAPSAKV